MDFTLVTNAYHKNFSEYKACFDPWRDRICRKSSVRLNQIERIKNHIINYVYVKKHDGIMKYQIFCMDEYKKIMDYCIQLLNEREEGVQENTRLLKLYMEYNSPQAFLCIRYLCSDRERKQMADWNVGKENL